jgi:hypothetical protein
MPGQNEAKAYAVRLYRELIRREPTLAIRAKSELAGKKLACWCSLDGPCHADVLAEIANS